jgi:hypothetical protein
MFISVTGFSETTVLNVSKYMQGVATQIIRLLQKGKKFVDVASSSSSSAKPTGTPSPGAPVIEIDECCFRKSVYQRPPGDGRPPVYTWNVWIGCWGGSRAIRKRPSISRPLPGQLHTRHTLPIHIAFCHCESICAINLYLICN